MSLPYDSRQSRFTSFPNFQEFIDTKKILCKCSKIIILGNTYQVSNFQRHSQSNNCTYRTDKQPSINVFFSKSKPGGNDNNDEKNEENRKRCALMCQSLCDLDYVNYVINSPASFGGGKRPEVIAKQLFPEKFPENTSFTRKKLNKKEREEFEKALESEATWRLDKKDLAIYHMQCEIKTDNKSAICNKCKELKSNKRLNEALKAGRAIRSTVKFTPRHYYNEPLLKLLKNTSLRQVWAATSNENDDAEFWTKLAQLGLSGAFNGDGTFTELVSLMVQIKEKKLQGKSLKGLRYSEHLMHFFSLLSESSREYEIFRKAFAGLSVQRIRKIRRQDSVIITNPDLIIENFMKFSQIISSINWNGPIVVMTDSTKLREKLVYAEELNYITGSILPHSKTTVEVLEDIHPKINFILEKNAIANQVRGIALKVPIGKVPPMMIAMIPTKGNEGAEHIAHLIRQVIEMAHIAKLNILSFGADGARAEFNAQSIIMNEVSNFLEYKDSFYKIHFKVPIYNGKPFIRIQDPKHAKKTARNQIFSGAKLLSLGIDTVLYRNPVFCHQSVK